MAVTTENFFKFLCRKKSDLSGIHNYYLKKSSITHLIKINRFIFYKLLKFIICIG